MSAARSPDGRSRAATVTKSVLVCRLPQISDGEEARAAVLFDVVHAILDARFDGVGAMRYDGDGGGDFLGERSGTGECERGEQQITIYMPITIQENA